MQRRSVVLPEPLGPMTTTASPRATASETSFSTFTAPNDFDTRRTAIIGGAASVDIAEALLEKARQLREAVADAKVDERDAAEDLESGEGALGDLAPGRGQLPDADDRHERGALDQHEAGVDEGWQRDANRLGEDHDAQHERTPHAEPARGVPLGFRQRQDGGAKRLAHEGREVEAEHEDAALYGAKLDPGIGQNVVHGEQEDEQGDAAHDIEVKLDKQASSEAAEHVQQRDREPEHGAQDDACGRDADSVQSREAEIPEIVDEDRRHDRAQAGKARRRSSSRNSPATIVHRAR